jgi:predicted AlkP superfamily pyrophosphatase or phosphodiesterase
MFIMILSVRRFVPASLVAFAILAGLPQAQTRDKHDKSAAPPRHNVIIFVADGLRRDSVTPQDMPTFYRLRTEGVDLRNSHSVYPSVTTANASAIATGHGLGDTGNYGNTLYPGLYLTAPYAPAPTDTIVPFLENDGVLASMNANFSGNYFGETTLLTAAHSAGFSVASVGKLGPTAIQLLPSVKRDELGQMNVPKTLIVDDSTGHANSIPLPLDFDVRLLHSGLPTEAPLRTNGYPDASQWSNGFSGNGAQAGTLAANNVQEQWFADVTTQLILPSFAEAGKPFVLLFWSRDPDGTQHNQGDSFQNLTPGINGETSRAALRNADHCLAQLLDWLDKHPAIKAVTDVLVTSDHGFATISRRELDAAGNVVSTPAAALTYTPQGTDKAEPASTLPTGFLAIDLALFTHQKLFDPSRRDTTGGSVYAEVSLSGETSSYPAGGSALLGDEIKQLDGSDARVILAANGGSDFLYIPSKDPQIANQTVADTVAALSDLDYISGIFVDDAFCPTPASCPGALPLSSVGLKGSSKIPNPTIVVTFKHFFLKPGDLLSGVQITDTNLQEGQGNHGALARDQTWNNMAAFGPDFKKRYIDPEPVGNIDIAPTLAAILGVEMPTHGTLKGRVMTEALATAKPALEAAPLLKLVSSPAANGRRTVLDYQQQDGVRYYDRACMIATGDAAPACPE